MWPCRTLEGLNGKMCELLHTSAVVQKMQGGLPLFWRRGAALPWPRDGLSAYGPVELSRVNGFAIRGALRPYIEFIPDALHREYESWRLRVGLYLAPQAGDKACRRCGHRVPHHARQRRNGVGHATVTGEGRRPAGDEISGRGTCGGAASAGARTAER